MVAVVVAVVVLLCSAVAATPLSYYYSSLLSSYSHIVLWSGGRKASRGVLVTFVVSCSSFALADDANAENEGQRSISGWWCWLLEGLFLVVAIGSSIDVAPDAKDGVFSAQII